MSVVEHESHGVGHGSGAPSQQRSILMRPGFVRAAWCFALFNKGLSLLLRPRPSMFNAFVQRDTVQPGGKLAQPLKGAYPCNNFYKDILDDIFSLFTVPNESPGHRQHKAAVIKQQPGKTQPVSPFCFYYEFFGCHTVR